MKYKKVLLFYNPYAGEGVFSNYLDKIADAFREKQMLLVLIRANGEGMLDAFFESEDMSDYDRIVVAGGDGTINIMVSAMVKHNIDLPLAMFPVGTANDLSHYFDYPDHMSELTDIAVSDKYTYMDVGTVNGRTFVNVLAMGMLVDVSQKTDPNMKNTLGVMAYYLRGLAEVPKLKPIPMKITTPEFEREVNMYAMLVMNGRSAGGFRRAAPKAVINDGMFDVIVFEDMPVVTLAPLLLEVLTGHHTENKNVLYFKTNSMKIESPEEVSTDVDGEEGEHLPLDIKMLHNRLKIVTQFNDMEGNVW